MIQWRTSTMMHYLLMLTDSNLPYKKLDMQSDIMGVYELTASESTLYQLKHGGGPMSHSDMTILLKIIGAEYADRFEICTS